MSEYCLMSADFVPTDAYSAAILALCNHAMLLWETRERTPAGEGNFDVPICEIVSAVGDTTERVKELLQLRIAQHLPISV